MSQSVTAANPTRTPHLAGGFAALCILMFLEHAVWGAWVPLLPLRMQELNFTPLQIGRLFGVLSLASLITPWLSGHMADRMVSAHWLLAVGHALNAILLWMAASATGYCQLLGLLLAAALIYIPTFTLTNHIVFRHLRDPVHEFGAVRLWGTASWVVMSALIGLWLARPAWLPFAKHAQMSDCLRLAAFMSVLLACFSFLIPATPPGNAAAAGRFAFIDVLRMVRNRSFLLMLIVSFVLSLINPFVYPHGASFLKLRGVSEAAVAPLLSLGQVGEVIAFMLLGPALRRWGYKTLFLVGIAAFALRFGVWSLGLPLVVVITTIPLHGISYAYFTGLGQTYTHQMARPDVRATAQSLHYFASAGIGGWLGNWLAARACEVFQVSGPSGAPMADYGRVFLIPTALAILCLIAFSLGFRSATPDPTTPAVVTTPEA